jgi:hypothetical protein
MVLSGQDIESGTSYSFMLHKREKTLLADLIDIADSMLSPFGDITDEMSLPTELAFLYDIKSNLNDRILCFAKMDRWLSYQGVNNCEEITIVDYGSGQGFASLCLLDWISRKGNIDSVKQIKLVDKDHAALKRALLHFSILYPKVEVIAYEDDFLSKDFAIECNSILTINLFSHVLSSEFRLIDHVSNLILKGHNLLMHNIILDELSSREFPNKLNKQYFSFIHKSIKDKTGCEGVASDNITLQRGKSFKYDILSRKSLLDISIPEQNNIFSNLCPGEPIKKLYNVPQRIMWHKQPHENKTYCEKLGTINKNSLNQETVAFYEKATKDGITEAYNNLAILYFQGALGSENAEKKAIELFELAAIGGSDKAMMNLASYYMDKENANEAIPYYILAAEKGNAIALFNLALLANFGLYGQEKDLIRAEKLYRECLSMLEKDLISSGELRWKSLIIDEKDKDMDFINYQIQQSCCLNLMLLLEVKGEHYVKILDVYHKAMSPSKELEYTKEILQVTHEGCFSYSILDILSLENPTEKEKPFQKYNRAIFLYNGLIVKGGYFDRKLKQDIDAALDLMKALAEDKNNSWEDRDKYVYHTLAIWTKSHKEKFGDLSEIYWRKAAECDSDYRCEYLTNLAQYCDISEEEKRSIWKEFAFGGGCKHCHECDNYNESKRACPKAQLKWSEFEPQDIIATNLINQSASQHYDAALFHLGYRCAISDNIPSLKGDEMLSMMGNTLYVHPPKGYNLLYPILAKDVYYDYLQRAAELNYAITRNIIPFAAEQRADRYNYIYWASIFCMGKGDIKEKRQILSFIQSYCNRTLDNYFNKPTICEQQMIEIAKNIANNTDDSEFICKVANFYYQGEFMSIAKDYYKLAKEKGAKDVDKILDEINEVIKRDKEKSLEYYDENEPFESNWADYLSDAFEGDPGNMWNID